MPKAGLSIEVDVMQGLITGAIRGNFAGALPSSQASDEAQLLPFSDRIFKFYVKTRLAADSRRLIYVRIVARYSWFRRDIRKGNSVCGNASQLEEENLTLSSKNWLPVQSQR